MGDCMKRCIFIIVSTIVAISILMYFYEQKETLLNKTYPANNSSVHIEYPYFNNTIIDNYITNYLNKNISEKMNMFEYFDEILLYDDVQNKKPNPEVYLKLMEKLKVRPEECLVIEDSLSGVQAAKNAKLEVVNIPDIGSLKNQDEIDKITDYKLNDMKEFWELIKDLNY